MAKGAGDNRPTCFVTTTKSFKRCTVLHNDHTGYHTYMMGKLESMSFRPFASHYNSFIGGCFDVRKSDIEDCVALDSLL